MLDTSSTRALRAVAFYLPQFHPTPENDTFWGPGFAEWHNVATARPRFRGHAQPHLPADLGFYDLRLAETRHAQAALARAAGLSGFCWYHYWFHGQRVLHRPFDAKLASADEDFPFMLCWANENWTRAWDGGPREVLIAQSYSDADTVAHARHLAPALADPRHIRIDGRPLFAVYNTDDLPDPVRWSDVFRDTLQSLGIAPYLLRVERALDRDTRPPAALGFDAALDFQPFSRAQRRLDLMRPALPARLRRRGSGLGRRFLGHDEYRDMAALVTEDLAAHRQDYLTFPGACPSWDNSSRRPPGQAIIYRNTSPALFRHWLTQKTRAFHPPTADENLFFVNAWNEWAEGNHLEPCRDHGHAWLDALRDGLASVVEGASVMQ